MQNFLISIQYIIMIWFRWHC